MEGFLDAGVPLAFGTDYPVEPITPFRGIYAGVTRSNEAGTSTLLPARQADHRSGALRLHPGLGVCGIFRNLKGKLTPGYVADFIVLDRDLTNVPAPEILKTRVLRTVVDGRTVYQAPDGDRRVTHQSNVTKVTRLHRTNTRPRLL